MKDLWASSKICRVNVLNYLRVGTNWELLGKCGCGMRCEGKGFVIVCGIVLKI